MERKTVGCSWKAAGSSSGEIVGYASTFGNVDLGGDVVERGAFASTVKKIKRQGIPLLADHVASTANVLGTIFDADEDARGLLIKARFSAADDAQRVRTKLIEGHVSKLSIGYETIRATEGYIDGRPVRFLEEVELHECSVVVFPMNTEAVITGAKAAGGDELLALRLRLAALDVALALAESRAG